MDNVYTPKKVCETATKFNIPIYQRLFEWKNDQIEQLLNDLYEQYNKNNIEPYYIGMLTLHKDDLVDGQQRFTVLSIIASVFKDYHMDWTKMAGKLSLSARPEDGKYLLSFFTGNTSEQENYKNEKMFNGRECVKEWIKIKIENEGEEKMNKFSKYVYEHCTFFTAVLPEKYEAKDLNSYFEAMNSTGRNLEAHEIIKVRDYLESMNSEQTKYTLIWNLVADMDRPLIRKRDNESEEDFRNRFLNSIYNFEEGFMSNFKGELNDFQLDSGENTSKQDFPSIRDIKENYKNPDVRRQDKYYGEGYHSMLNFPEFLLQVLYIPQLDAQTDISVNEFFSTHNLTETFKKYTNEWKEKEWKNFGKELLLYRLIYDYYFIRVANSEGNNYDLEATDADNSNNSTILKQYESFLYADSTSLTYYRWVAPMLKFLRENGKLSVVDVIKKLHTIDNKVSGHEQENVNEELTYSSPNTAYFLRRLDFFLWLANENGENGKKNEIISNYIFRRGINSKEHLHPQTEKENVTTNDDWKDAMHSFGNMFLISQSSNSTQSNNGINGKFINFADQVGNGYLESIKLYLVYEEHGKDFATWNPDEVKKHQEYMFKFLKETYNDNFLQITKED